MLEMFKRLFAQRRLDTQLVFLRDGKPIKDFRKAWLTACEDAKLEGKMFHGLRRTAIRNLVRSGVTETVCMAISGHRTRSVFDRYNITSDRDLKEATQKLSAYIQEQKNPVSGKVSGKVIPFEQRETNING
jgi:integrase